MAQFGAVPDGKRNHSSPIMTSAPRVCQNCGAEVFADAPEGLCTACLFETGLNLFANASVAAVDARGPEESAQVLRDKKKADRSEAFADFGDYELLDVIGRGAQGVVYRARQKSLNRTVALKVIGLGHWAADAHLKRFRREAEAAANLDHPGIVPIYEVGERDGSCYFSMKLVEGGQLDVIAGREPMPIRGAVELIAKIARTVHYAHEHGILHRDIKPGNILLDQKGEPHLTDFGLARLIETDSTVTRTQEILGTPSYMAPEQAVGNNPAVSRLTDVYEIGAVLYHLLTGQPPFAGGTTYETIKLLLDTEPRQPRLLNSKVDRDLSTICLKCLEKDPKRRYSSALALAEDLERWLRHEPILARHTGILTRGKKWVRRNPTSALLAASLVALAASAGWIVSKTELIHHPLTTGVAVLPFENLSDEKEHAFFADGVQDDILTKLAKIADLKVISRTSVMQYRGKQNARQIGNALGVSHVLEGTVRRFGEKLHVNTQLVDTRTDTNIWAEAYDRDLNEVFAIETEVAQSIATRLRTKISAHERAALQERPTKDLVAYDLYVQGTSWIDQHFSDEANKEREKAYLHAISLLDQAIARDPAFVLAHCRSAEANVDFYFLGYDRTSKRLERAKSKIDEALRLQPNSGEAHLALAAYFYHGYFDYDRARYELDVARRSLPNNARIFQWTALIDRRQNRWQEAVRNIRHALELDPQNAILLGGNCNIAASLRDYKKFSEFLDRLLALDPKKDHTWAIADKEVLLRADTRPLHAFLQRESGDNYDLSHARFNLALQERDSAGAERALAKLRALGEDSIDARAIGTARFNGAYLEGLIARMNGDDTSARSAFERARPLQEKELLDEQHRGPHLCVLGLIDAGLGRKEDALREGRRALEITPAETDSLDTADVVYYYAVICAWVGERDLAIEQLERSARMPAGVSYAEIRLDPHWDPIRDDSRFEKIVASLTPK